MLLFGSLILGSVRQWYGPRVCLHALGRGASHRHRALHYVLDLSQVFLGEVELCCRSSTLNVIRPPLYLEAAFGRQDHLVPTTLYRGFEGLSQETLGGTDAVGLGGI